MGPSSPSAAASDYGVVVTEVDGEYELDVAATERLRRDKRFPTKLFHNGAYVEAMV